MLLRLVMLGATLAWAGGAGIAAARAAEPSTTPTAASAATPASAASSSATAAWVPSEEDAWLFAITAGRQRLGDGVRGHDGPDGLCLDLGDIILATDIAVRLDRQSGRATGWAFDEGRTLTIDRPAGTARIGGETRAIAPGAIVDADGGWCVRAAVLEDWLGVTIAVDRSNAVLSLSAETPLPFERAADRRAAAARLGTAATPDITRFPRRAEPYRLWRTPAVDIDAGLTIQHAPGGGSGGAGTTIARRYGIQAQGELLGMSVSARLASDDRGRPAGARVTAYRIDGDGGLPLGATEVQLGDVSVLPSPLALAGAAGRGIAIGNRPVGQSGAVDRTEFRGDLLTGWDVELYHNGRLIGLRTGDDIGRFHFADVDLSFGSNRFELVHHGPRGEVRRETISRPVGTNTMPVGATRWWLAALEAGHDLVAFNPSDVSRETSGDVSGAQSGDLFRTPGTIGWRFGAGIDHGLARQTTVSATAHLLRSDNGWLGAGDVVVRQGLGDGIAELGAAILSDGGGAVGGGWTGALGATRVRLGAVRGFGGYAGPRLIRGERSATSLAIDRALRIGKVSVPLAFGAGVRWRHDGSRIMTLDGRVSAAVAGVSMTGGLEWRSERRDGRAQQLWSATLMANARVGTVRLRGDVRYQLSGEGRGDDVFVGPRDRAGTPNRGTLQAGLVADGIVDDRTGWRAQLGWAGGRWRAAGGLSRDWGGVRGSLQGGIDGSGAVTVAVGAAVSFGPDDDGRWRLMGQARAQSARIAATVFVDANGDGRQQADEPGLADVGVTSGGRTGGARTGADGRVMLDGVERDRPLLVAVDPSTIADPMMRATSPDRAIVARAGIVTRVAIPVVPTGSIETTLTDPAGAPVAGAEVEVVGADGAVRATGTSEFDGYIAIEGVPHGRWALRLAAAPARVLGAATALADGIIVDAATPRAVLPPVRWAPLEARGSVP